MRTVMLRPDSTGAFSRRNAKYFACFFWIVSNQVEIIYSSGRNSKETGEIIRISPRKSARGIRPSGDGYQHNVINLYSTKEMNN
jgi:hypothetical protein